VEPKRLERRPGPSDEFPDEGATDAPPSRSGLHVDVANSPDSGLSLVRIDIETTQPDEISCEVRKEKDLTRAIEAVPAGLPLGDESADECKALIDPGFDESIDLRGKSSLLANLDLHGTSLTSPEGQPLRYGPQGAYRAP
jgi:hypothetical protein